jgi:hypothetical protein
LKAEALRLSAFLPPGVPDGILLFWGEGYEKRFLGIRNAGHNDSGAGQKNRAEVRGYRKQVKGKPGVYGKVFPRTSRSETLPHGAGSRAVKNGPAQMFFSGEFEERYFRLKHEMNKE